MSNCLACAGSNLVNYINLGNHPNANSFTIEFNKDLPRTPLMVDFCRDCSHSQLRHYLTSQELFEDYLYVSGTSKTLDKHFSDYVDYALDRLAFKLPCPRVLEIASNDGSLLSKFKAKGCEVVGVDPAANLLPLAQDKGIETIVDFFPSSLVEGKFDIIVANNVLAHHPSPRSFLKSCAEHLKRTKSRAGCGTLYVEFPLWTNSVNTLDIGQVYFDHQSYITLNSFKIMAEAANLTIVNIEEFPKIHGGTVRMCLQAVNMSEPHCDKFLNMLKTEKIQGFHDLSKYEKFNQEIQTNLGLLLSSSFFQNMVGYKVVGYGAAAKASTILNTLKGNLPVEYIIDDAPMKVGRFMPGLDIPIKPTASIVEEPGGLCFVIFAHNFKEEIKERLKQYRQPHHKDAILNIVPYCLPENLYD